MEKEFRFEDNSFIKFQMIEGCLSIFIQSNHLGKEIKYTSSGLILTEEETNELIEWIRRFK